MFRFVLKVNEETIVSDITANDGRWHHIVATWDSNGGTYTMYKDGVQQANGTGLSNGMSIPGNETLHSCLYSCTSIIKSI